VDGGGTALPLLSAVAPGQGDSMSLGKRTAAIASPTTCQRPLSYEQQEGQGAVRQVSSGAIAIYSWLPSGSSSGDFLRRVLGRVGADVSISFRRRDRGLGVLLLSASTSLLTRMVEYHSE
jgi:hypothetical protein